MKTCTICSGGNFLCLVSWIAASNICSSERLGFKTSLVSENRDGSQSKLLHLRGGSASDEENRKERLMEEISKLDPVTLRQLYKFACSENSWDITTEDEANNLDPRELMELEEAWDGECQDGIRIKSLPVSFNASCPVKCGDIIVSVDGVDCTKLSLPEVILVIANKNPYSSNCTLVLKRLQPPLNRSYEFHTVEMRKAWVDEDEIKRATMDLIEEEATEFLSTWSNFSKRTNKISPVPRRKRTTDK
mmetsp:Transcript_21385/g.70852  ORF Transcript_21385/g.70852 Transcript_21385/m.70852 type:complete len:247 (-) Transcript_21385:70-810(-)